MTPWMKIPTFLTQLLSKLHRQSKKSQPTFLPQPILPFQKHQTLYRQLRNQLLNPLP